MIKKIIAFNEPGFYQGKAGQIKNAVNEYDTVRNNPSVPDEEKIQVKSNSEHVLENIIIENGFRQPENAFISLEKEFYTENQLDPEKIEKFQKEMLLQFADQQTKWTFSGTTSLYSPVARHNIEKQGHEYSALLPGELKDGFENRQIKKHINDPGADFQIFLYPDGSVENDYVKDKTPFSFDKLTDRSGFDFKQGYSPNNTVKRKEWTSGFNEKDEWQRVDLNEESFYHDAPGGDDGKFIFANALYDPGQIGLVAFPDDDHAYIFDENLSLKESKQENFYSITGELYGVREVDINKSIESVKNYLKRNNIKKIAGFVLGNTDESVREYYSGRFKDFVGKETNYYAKHSEDLKNILREKYERAREKELSNGLLTGFYTLAGRGRRGDELYSGLVPSVVKDEYTVKPDIFGSGDDLNTFISMKNIKEIMDDEDLEIINSLSVPDSKKEALSNATQNLLHNYKTLFVHSGMTPGKVVKAAYDIIVKKNKDTVKEMKGKKITTEMNLFDFIKQSSSVSTGTHLPGFKKAYKKEKNYHDIHNKDEFYLWAAGKSPEPGSDIIQEIKSVITQSDISQKEKNSYTGIIEKGLNNKEAKDAKTAGSPGKGEYGETVSRVEELITKTGLPEEKKEAMIRVLSLIPRGVDPDQRDTGVLSAGAIADETIDRVWEKIAKADGPGEKKKAFSLAVQNVFAEYPALKISTGMPPVEIVSAVEAVILKNSSDETYRKTRLFFENNIHDLVEEASKENIYPVTRIKEDVFLAKRSESYGRELDLLEDRDIDTFALSPLFYNSGIEEEERKEIIDLIKSVSIPARKADNFTGSIVNVIKSYREKIEPGGIRAADAVRSVVYALRGERDKIVPGLDIADLTGEAGEKLSEYYGEVKDLDLTSEEDVNTLVKSHFFAETGFSEKDEPEIAGILNEIRVPGSKAGDFTDGILRTLRHYRSRLAPLDVEPAAAIRSLGDIVAGKRDRVPRKLQKVFDEILVKGMAPSGSLPHEKINIFNKEDYSTFVKSPEFKRSGISKKDLDRLISYYSDADESSGEESLGNFKQIPVHFNTIESIDHDRYKIELPLDREPHYSLSNPDIYSTGMMISQSRAEGDNIVFTDVGRSYLSAQAKNSITSQVRGARMTKRSERKQEKLRRIPSVNQVSGSAVASKQGDRQFVYTAPFLSFSRKGGAGQRQYSQEMYMPGSEATGETGMNGEYFSREIPGRVQENYMADSLALRKADSEKGVKPQPESAGSGGNENKIRRTLDDLFKDFINRMDNIF